MSKNNQEHRDSTTDFFLNFIYRFLNYIKNKKTY